MHAGRQGILQWSEEADGVPRNLLIPRTQAGIKESLWNSTEPGGCAWSQVDIRGRKRAVRASRRIPRIQMEVVESGEFAGLRRHSLGYEIGYGRRDKEP